MTDNNGGPRILGSLRTLDEEPKRLGAVRVEDVYDTSIEDLWSALTEPSRLARWIGEFDGDLTIGGQFHAHFTSTWTGLGRVDICEPPHRLLVTTWDEDEDPTAIEAVLEAHGDKVLLVIEERGLPLQDLAGHGAGWQAHIEDLATYLAGRPQSDWKDRWDELSPTYERLADSLA
jgi:uncharacterized protein YndB with AHSA1/START domain